MRIQRKKTQKRVNLQGYVSFFFSGLKILATRVAISCLYQLVSGLNYKEPLN